MNKLIISFILSLFTAVCSISSVAIASDCATDPNECTLSKLCEMATSTDSNGNTIWIISSDKQKHATVAQSLGIECGVKPIVDPCDLDPNECKLNQICDKATTEISGKKSWDESADAYVSFAKKFGLKCDVETFYSEDAKLKDDQQNKKIYLCNKATITKNGQTSWNTEFIGHVLNARKNNLTCGVNAISSPKWKINPKDNLCSMATIIKNGVISWNTEFPSYVIAAKELGQTCNVKTISHNDIKKAFTEKPKLYRQKLQYALKEFQFYSYAIDGLWGDGTRSGFVKFIKAKGLQGITEDQVFNFLLSKVNVPSSFIETKKCSYNEPQNCLEKMSDSWLCNYATTIGSNARRQWKKQNTQAAVKAKAEAIKRGLSCSIGKTKSVSVSKKKVILKKKETVSNQDNAGLTAIISNPSISGRQALAICRPQAKLAKSRSSASANSSRNNRTRTYDLDCSFGSCTARDMTPSGGKWGGILQGLNEVMAGKNAYNAVMDSCLAEYGWRD